MRFVLSVECLKQAAWRSASKGDNSWPFYPQARRLAT